MPPGFDFFLILLLTWPSQGWGSQIRFIFLSLYAQSICITYPAGLRENLAFSFLEQRWSVGQQHLRCFLLGLCEAVELWLALLLSRCVLCLVSTDRSLVILLFCPWQCGPVGPGCEMMMLCGCCFSRLLLRASPPSSLTTRTSKRLVNSQRSLAVRSGCLDEIGKVQIIVKCEFTS